MNQIGITVTFVELVVASMLISNQGGKKSSSYYSTYIQYRNVSDNFPTSSFRKLPRSKGYVMTVDYVTRQPRIVSTLRFLLAKKRSNQKNAATLSRNTFVLAEHTALPITACSTTPKATFSSNPARSAHQDIIFQYDHVRKNDA